MILKECLIKLAINTIRLHFETGFLVNFVKEVSFFQKNNANLVILTSFPFFQLCDEFRNSPTAQPSEIIRFVR